MMGIEPGTLGTADGSSNHSPIKDLQMVFSKLIHMVLCDVHVIQWLFVINQYI